jgi:hypothetical protein
MRAYAKAFVLVTVLLEIAHRSCRQNAATEKAIAHLERKLNAFTIGSAALKSTLAGCLASNDGIATGECGWRTIDARSESRDLPAGLDFGCGGYPPGQIRQMPLGSKHGHLRPGSA